MKVRLQLIVALVAGFLVTGCMADAGDEYDDTDDIGYVRHDLNAMLESGDEGTDEDDGRILLPTAGATVDVSDDAFDAIFEPQPQPWEGEDGMQESGNGDQSGGE